MEFEETIYQLASIGATVVPYMELKNKNQDLTREFIFKWNIKFTEIPIPKSLKMSPEALKTATLV